MSIEADRRMIPYFSLVGQTYWRRQFLLMPLAGTFLFPMAVSMRHALDRSGDSLSGAVGWSLVIACTVLLGCNVAAVRYVTRMRGSHAVPPPRTLARAGSLVFMLVATADVSLAAVLAVTHRPFPGNSLFTFVYWLQLAVCPTFHVFSFRGTVTRESLPSFLKSWYVAIVVVVTGPLVGALATPFSGLLLSYVVLVAAAKGTLLALHARLARPAQCPSRGPALDQRLLAACAVALLSWSLIAPVIVMTLSFIQ